MTVRARKNAAWRRVDIVAVGVIVLSVAVVIAAAMLVGIGLQSGRTDVRLFGGIASFLLGAIGLAWAVGRLRRSAAITPEAIAADPIGPDPGADPTTPELET